MGQRSSRSNAKHAAMKDAQIKLRMEDCARSMGQLLNNAATGDALPQHGETDSVKGMEHTNA